MAQTPTFSMKISNVDVTSACAGIGITFTNTSTIPAPNLHWDFGDNYSINNTNSIAHTYNIGGTYIVRLTNTQNQSSVTKTITIYNNPTASFSISDSIACINSTLTFNSTSNPGNSPLKYYSWTFGDGNVRPLETESSIKYDYAAAGNYVPILTVRDENGCSGTSTTTKQIKISDTKLKSAFTANGSDFYSCTNSIEIENTTNENGLNNVTYLWDFGDKNTSNQKSPQQHAYSNPGIYDITLQVNYEGTTGCSPSYTHKVYIGKPDITINAPSAICTNNSYPISAKSNTTGWDSENAWSWTTTNGLQLNNDSSSIFTNTIGTPTLSVSNKNGCPSTQSININSNTGPAFDLQVTPNSGICVGVEIAGLLNQTNNVPIQKYVWSPTSTISDTITKNQYNYTYTTAGQYQFMATAIGTNGCNTSKYVTLNVADQCIDNGMGSAYNPIFSFQSVSCDNKYTINISNKNSAKPVDYWTVNGTRFNANNGESATIKLSPIVNGAIYAVNTYFKDGSNDLNRKITIIDETADFDILNTENASLYCANNKFNFSTDKYTNPENIDSYNWTIKDQQDANVGSFNTQDLTYTFPNTGKYTISLSITDIRTPGCVSLKSQTIDVNGIVSGDFKADHESFCNSNPTVNFTLYNINAPSSLSKVTWDFGDGIKSVTPSNINNISHSYNGNNSSYIGYPVSATLEDASGCTMNVLKNEYIRTYSPKIGFFKKDTVLCNTKDIIINNTSDAKDAQYTWKVGNVTQTSNGNTPFQGNFANIPLGSDLDVALHLVDAGGCTKDTLVKSYIKYRQPKAKYVISNLDAFYNCPPFTLNIENASLNYDSMHWSINNTFSTNKKDSFYYTVIHPGPIDISLEAILDGCSDPYNQNYTVRGPVAHLITKDTIGCTPYTTLLYLSDKTDIVSYQWDKGDGITYITDKVSDSMRFTYKKGGIYRPTVTFVGKEGCSDKQEYPSPIIALQSVDLQYKDNYIFCSNDSIIYLTAKASNVKSFTWSQDPTSGYMSNSEGDTIGIIPKENTTYQVTAHSGNTCPDESGSISVKLATASVVTISPNLVTQPAGNVFTINPTITNDNLGVQYYWSPDYRLDNKYLKNPTIVADKDTVYYLNIKNNEGCTSSDSLRVKVLCNTSKLLMANAFTPNGDGKNDRFYVTGYGIRNVIHFVIYDRWGKKVFEKNNVAANDFNEGWDGQINGQLATPGSYIYIAEIECTEGNKIPLKGSVILIR